MIIINRQIIINYINKITRNDIREFAKYQNVDISENEVNIIDYYIHNKYNEFIDNPEMVLQDIKPFLSNNVYSKIKELYLKYKWKINILR